MKRTLQQAIELITQKTENANNEITSIQKKAKNMTADEIVRASANVVRLQGEYAMGLDILNILKTVEIECNDSIKLTKETWDRVNYIQERVETNIEEIISSIKCEYDAKVEKVINPYEDGDIQFTTLKITPVLYEERIPMKYMKVQKVVQDEE